MTKPNTPTTLSLRTPADLVEVLPYLLGYTPQHRLSVIFLANGRIACTASVDAQAGTDALPGLVEAVYSTGATSVVIFGHAASPFEAWHIASLAAEGLEHLVRVDHILVCTPDGWASVDHEIPWELEPYSTGLVTTESVYAGLSKVDSRDEIAALVAPNTEHIAALAALPEMSADDDFTIIDPQQDDALVDAVRALQGRKLTAQDVRRLGRLLTRDEVGSILMAMKQEEASSYRAVFQQVATYYSDDEPGLKVDLLLALVAFCAWIEGEGVTICVALDRIENRRRAGLIHPEAVELCDFMEKAQRRALSPREFLTHRDEN